MDCSFPAFSVVCFASFSGLIYTDLRDMHWGILHQQQQCPKEFDQKSTILYVMHTFLDFKVKFIG